MNLRFVFSLIVSLLSLLPAAAQDLTRNWIRERIFLDAEGKECVTSVQYFDGIGRETLLLTDGLSPGGDVAGALTGESFAGRTSAKWLPATGLTGFDFLTPERVKSLAVSSHEGDSVPFSLTRRDALGRVSSVRNAGGDLAGKAKYRYFVRDRLGSVRSVADEDGNVLQQNLYYAWGGAWGDVCTAPGFQSYKYCGKYLDRKHGLDLYDYGARLYDPAAAFWTSPDPLCEKYYNISPYAFCNDNPVTFIDPDGRVIRIPKNQKKIVRYINRLAQGIFDVDKNGYLYLKKKTNTQGFSSYYTKKINGMINSKNCTVTIYIGETAKYKSEDKGKIKILSVGEYGEGISVPWPFTYENSKKIYNDVTVTISDKQHKVPSYKGKMIHQYPQDILCHELVGHATPKVLGRDTGYAIENENKVWKELNYPLRKNNEKDKE